MAAGIDPRTAADATVAREAERLVALSHAVHGDAELAFEEHRSSDRLITALSAAGLKVETGVAGLDTAFVATAGSGPLTIAICAEYDALPGIGHACGHNVIAAAAVGAGIALAPLADELGLTVKVMGTPAEEGGGGKILMLDAGVFDGVHAAMMVHPAPDESLIFPCLAVEHLSVAYLGREAHASAYPHLGINAADALTVAQVSIGLLRQHLEPTHRVHGIVTDGGDAPNIVPGHTRGAWYVRAATLEQLAELSPRVRACFEAGATATGLRGRGRAREPALQRVPHRPDAAGGLRAGGDGDRSSVPQRATPSVRSPARPTWRTCRCASRPSTRCSASRRAARSTISPSSPRRRRTPRPTVRCSMVPEPWPGPPSRSPATRTPVQLLLASLYPPRGERVGPPRGARGGARGSETPRPRGPRREHVPSGSSITSAGCCRGRSTATRCACAPN
jgi:amidohydrolase